jgi:hypothetical protein
MSEKKEKAVALAIIAKEDELEVASGLPKLVQLGILLASASQLFQELVFNMTDEEVKSFDNKKVQ